MVLKHFVWIRKMILILLLLAESNHIHKMNSLNARVSLLIVNCAATKSFFIGEKCIFFYFNQFLNRLTGKGKRAKRKDNIHRRPFIIINGHFRYLPKPRCIDILPAHFYGIIDVQKPDKDIRVSEQSLAFSNNQ